jgi:hypothetical protein
VLSGKVCRQKLERKGGVEEVRCHEEFNGGMTAWD